MLATQDLSWPATAETFHRFQLPAHEDLAEGPDVAVGGDGTVVLFRPVSDRGREWIAGNTLKDERKPCGAAALSQRFASYLIEGMCEAGLRFG